MTSPAVSTTFVVLMNKIRPKAAIYTKYAHITSYIVDTLTFGRNSFVLHNLLVFLLIGILN